MDNPAIIGGKLDKLVSKVEGLAPRRCLSDIVDYLGDSENDNVCVISGLQRTGKTTLMFHALADMSLAERKRSAYVDVGTFKNTMQVKRLLDELEESGVETVFLDEVTRIPDFVDMSRIYHSLFTKAGMKIVLTGTDSLKFHMALNDDLYAKATVVETTRIPFSEYSDLTGMTHIDQYIAFGGIFPQKNSRIAENILKSEFHKNIPVMLKHAGMNYLSSAISANIQRALYHDKGRIYGGLASSIRKKNVARAINRLVLSDLREWIVDILSDSGEFVANDLAQTKANLSDRGIIISDEILDKISDAYGRAIDMFDETVGEDGRIRREVEDRLTDVFIDDLRGFLSTLDVVRHCWEFRKDGKIRLPLFTQPALRWSLVLELAGVMSSDEIFLNGFDDWESDMIFTNMFNSVQGKMLEEIVLIETMEKLPYFTDICKFSTLAMSGRTYNRGRHMGNDLDAGNAGNVPKGEVDMVITDKKSRVSHLFEIKHSQSPLKSHERHMHNEEFVSYLTKRLGTKLGRRFVIYDGPSGMSNTGVFRMNLHDWLKAENPMDVILAVGEKPDSLPDLRLK